jgi:hypothetical protein
MITSGGNRNPAKLDLGAGAARRRGISPAFLSRPSVNATEPLGDLVFAFPALAVDHGDVVRGGRGPDPAGEPAGHPDQVRVVQLLVIAVQAPPPGPKPARLVAQRVVADRRSAR